MRINVNARDITFPGKTLSYEEAVELAGKPPRDDWTVVYWGTRPNGDNYTGSLTVGQEVEMADGMKVQIAHTGSA